MKDIYKKLLVVAALFVVGLELASLGGFGIFNSAPPYVPPVTNQTIPPVIQTTGVAYANATVTGFRPYLVVSSLGNITEAQVREIPGVQEIVRSQGAYVIGVQDHEDLDRVHASLDGMGIAAQIFATLRLEGMGVLVKTDGTTQEITVPSVGIELTLAKPIALQTKLGLRVNGAQVRDGQFITGQEVVLDFIPHEVTLPGTAHGQDTVYTYEYSWEERGFLNATAMKMQYGNGTDVFRNDGFIVNKSALEVSLLAQNKTYIIGVQGNRVLVARNFMDSEQARTDFGENTVFENSYIITRNASIEERVPTNITYMTAVALNENMYGIKTVFAEAKERIGDGEPVSINMTILANGPLVSSIVSANIVQ